MSEERTIQNSWTRKRLTVRSLFSHACACARGIDRKTLDARRGQENNHFWVRNNKSKLAKPLSIRFPRSNHRGEERCSLRFRFRERVNKPKNRYTPEGVERARRSREPSKLGNIEGLEVWLA